MTLKLIHWDPSIQADLEWLHEQDLLRVWNFFESPESEFLNYPPNPPSPGFKPRKEMMRVLMEFAEGIRAEKSPEVRESDFFLSLMASLAIQRRERLATVSLCPAYGTSSPGAQTIRGSIGTIVLNSLPFPDESTSLERIIAFKNDPDKKRKRELLQRWTHRLAVKGISSEHEVTQELEWALHDYEEHMRFHKMKANRGILETVVATSAEIAEDLVKFRWGKLAQSLFSTSHREIDLLEAELKAPGRELAYVSKARTQLE